MRSMIVEVEDTSNSEPLTKSQRLTRKNLLRVKPWDYLKESSNPHRRLPERVVLQTLKLQFVRVTDLKDDALKERREGYPAYGEKLLHRLKHSLKRLKRWRLSHHLLYRFILWMISELKQAKLVLRALGLTAEDLKDPRLRRVPFRAVGNAKRPVLFTKGEEYNTRSLRGRF